MCWPHRRLSLWGITTALKYLIPRSTVVALALVLAVIASACSSGEPAAGDVTPGSAEDIAAQISSDASNAADSDPADEQPTPTTGLQPELDLPEALRDKPTGTMPVGPVSELGIEDLIIGDGAVAGPGSTVKVNYVGQLACTGGEFDSSWSRNVPLDFTLGTQQVIYGWDAGVEGMQVGGRRQLTIPYWMAYGERGTSTGSIGPLADLVFVVDLLEVTDSGQTPAPLTAPVEPEPEEVNPLKPIPTLPDGPVTDLIIEDIIEGTGPTATTGSLVDVNYVGVLACNGREFDASYNIGQTFNFPLGAGQVITGWDVGVEGMRVGGQRQLTIPAVEAYGERNSGAIPANADLVFVVDLVSVVEPVAAEDRPDAVRPTSISGELEILDIVEGIGAEVERDQVLVGHLYAETLSDNAVFTSTWDDGGLPIEIGTGEGALVGIIDGLLGMKEGGTRQIIIPPEMAFGSEGTTGIGPDETLLVIIELLQIKSS